MKTRRRNNTILKTGKVLAIIKVIVILVLFIFLVSCVYNYFSSSSTYKLKKVEIKGLNRLTREKVIAISGLKLGQNIFSINIKNTKNVLKNIRQIDNIELERNYPDTILITVNERVPVAQIVTDVAGDVAGNATKLVDENGVIFSGEMAELPKIVRTVDERALKCIARFLPELKKADSGFYGNIATISASSPDDIILNVYGIDIRWGKADDKLKEKVTDLKSVLTHMAEMKKKCSSIDIRFWEKDKRDVIVK